jgi:hypothetical protein
MKLFDCPASVWRCVAYSSLVCFCVAASAQPAPSTCNGVASEVRSLTHEVRGLQSELSTAAPGAKPRLVAAIRKLNAQLAPKQKALKACRPPAPR